MKNIKKVLALLLACVLVFSLASCSLVNEEDTDITNDTIKIGVILRDTKDSKTGNTGVNVKAINRLTSLDYGIEDKRFRYVENVNPDDPQAVEAALKSLINFECSIIFATDRGYYDDVQKVASSNTAVSFAVYGAEGNGANIYGYKANITDASYLAGITAGMKTAELEINQIGFIIGDKNDLTTLNAFAAGAKSVNEDVKINAIVSSNAASSCKTLIDYGCVVIASDYENEDIARLSTDSDVFFCGFGTDTFSKSEDSDDDKISRYENSYLCAPIYDFTQYYIDTIKAVVDATQIKNFNGGYSTCTTMLSDINEKTVAKGTDKAVEAAKEKLDAGTLKIELSATKADDCVTIMKVK